MLSQEAIYRRLIVVAVAAMGSALHVPNGKNTLGPQSSAISLQKVSAGMFTSLLVGQYDEAHAERARKRLADGAKQGAKPEMPTERGSVFEAVQISFPLQPPFIDHDPATGIGQANKNIVHFPGQNGLVYAAGIADESDFETDIGNLGFEVHAFDCTINDSAASVRSKPFKFHQWCLGSPAFFEGNYYTQGKAMNYEFKWLNQSVRELSHSARDLDLLKFDIEGFEWRLFEHDLLLSDIKPTQLSFELHTEHANASYVPPSVVQGKGYVEVNELFLKLYNLGYRVISKELNNWDPHCAEFVLLNVPRISK